VEDDGEAALLVACATVDIGPATPVLTEVHIKEDRLFVKLGDKAMDCARWILDTGATNHITGNHSAFSELDTKVHGSICFDDSSIAGIEGRGTVLLKCKNNEHRVWDSLIKMATSSFCLVDAKGRLMAKVDRSANRLYVLELNIARPVCLMA
jgi:hypothetical protein